MSHKSQLTQLLLNDEPLSDSQDIDQPNETGQDSLVNLEQQNRRPAFWSAGKSRNGNTQDYRSLSRNDSQDRLDVNAQGQVSKKRPEEKQKEEEDEDDDEDDDEDELTMAKKSFLNKKPSKGILKDKPSDPSRPRRLRFFDRKRSKQSQESPSPPPTPPPAPSSSNRSSKQPALLTPQSMQINKPIKPNNRSSQRRRDSIDDMLNEQNRSDNGSMGKIKILIPKRKHRTRLLRYQLRHCTGSCCCLLLLLGLMAIVFTLLYSKRLQLNQLLSERMMSGIGGGGRGASSVKKNLVLNRERCGPLQVTSVWNLTLPQLTIESALRMVDVNSDGELDVIMGFGTGADMAKYPQVVCQVYFNQNQNDSGCGGGVMALDGHSGQTLWHTYTLHEIFALNCNLDIDGDKVNDCLAAGRMAGMYALSGRTGRQLWRVDPTQGDSIIATSNFYNPLLIEKDADNDGQPDIVVMHGGDPLRKPTDRVRIPARLLVMSARTGQILRWAVVPDNSESYYSPQLLYRQDSRGQRRPYLLYGTGGETHGGSLYIVALDELLLRGSLINSVALYTDCCKGVMAPATLIDLNEDHTHDIVLAAFNSTVLVIDGQTLRLLWRRKFGQSESYSTPAVGFFNHDHVPDFLVQYQYGPGFPIYYYSQVQVLDGRDGRPLLNNSIKMLIGSQSSPLTISVADPEARSAIEAAADGHQQPPSTSTRTFGHDLFLFWDSTCEHSGLRLDGNPASDNQQAAFKLRFANVHEASRADYCRLRFKKQMKTRLLAMGWDLNQVTLYDSSDPSVKQLEANSERNYTQIGQEFLRRHPDYAVASVEDLPPPSAQPRLRQQPIRLPSETTSMVDNGLLPPLNFLQPNNNFNSNNSAIDAFAKYKSQFLFPTPATPLQPMQSMQQPEMAHFERPVDENFFNALQGNFGGVGNLNEINSQDDSLDANLDMQRRPEDLLDRFEAMERSRKSENDDMAANEPDSINIFKQLWPRAGRDDHRRRKKRHVGVHDGEGVQRIISTGTLAPSTEPGAIDVIFTTFWIPPSKKVKLVTKQLQQCLDFYMRPELEQIRFNPKSNLIGYDHDAYVDYVNDLCEQILHKGASASNGQSAGSTSYSPFNVPMGSLTVYRKRIRCSNDGFSIKPFAHQIWPSYMGIKADSVANV